jgi:hypothetical protein
MARANAMPIMSTPTTATLWNTIMGLKAQAKVNAIPVRT